MLSPLLILGWYCKLDIQPVIVEAHSLNDFDKGGVQWLVLGVDYKQVQNLVPYLLVRFLRPRACEHLLEPRGDEGRIGFLAE